MMDGVRASGNRDVHVKMALTNRGLRLGPYTVPVDEEVESQHMKFIQYPPGNEMCAALHCGSVCFCTCGLEAPTYLQCDQRLLHCSMCLAVFYSWQVVWRDGSQVQL